LPHFVSKATSLRIEKMPSSLDVRFQPAIATFPPAAMDPTPKQDNTDIAAAVYVRPHTATTSPSEISSSHKKAHTAEAQAYPSNDEFAQETNSTAQLGDLSVPPVAEHAKASHPRPVDLAPSGRRMRHQGTAQVVAHERY
jgi:hypothetical protein